MRIRKPVQLHLHGKRASREEQRDTGTTAFSSPHAAKENVMAWIPAPPEIMNETYMASVMIKSSIYPSQFDRSYKMCCALTSNVKNIKLLTEVLINS